MSSTDSVTTYQFGFYINKGEVNEGSAASFTTATGMTDASAIGFVEAFKALPWPIGTQVSASVTKHQMTDVQSEGDAVTGTFH